MTLARVFKPRCIALDLEICPKDNRLHQIGALRADTGESLHWRGPANDLSKALDQLDALAGGAAFVLGHNLIRFDLPHLAAQRPGLALLQLPAIDTLWLNPLAFPRNPYHHLVKHYQDGPLCGGHRNNPLEDAKLALAVLADQQEALRTTQQQSPGLVAAWHWLTTQRPTVSGINRFFAALRDQVRPSDDAAHAALGGCSPAARTAARS